MVQSQSGYLNRLCLLVLAVAFVGVTSASASTLVKFSVSAAGTAAGQGTFPAAINASGVIAGYYIDANNVHHGFERASNGAITNFDDPNAGTSAGQGTWAFGINATGTIAGYYIDSSYALHGYSFSQGVFTEIDAAGAAGTLALSINDAGTIAGTYFDPAGVDHGFVRNATTGVITSIDAPGAGTGSGQGTMTPSVGGINTQGDVTGD